MDLRTERQKKIDERNEKIVAAYKSLHDENPGVSCHRIMTAIADKFSMTRTGIENVIIKAGLYQRKKRA